MTEVKLTKGLVAFIDDEDFDKIKNFKWCFGGGYALSYVKGSYARGKCEYVYMHRVIMNAPKELEIDHINRNKIDNRKINLRLCDHSQNTMNVKRKPESSKYKGVHFCKETDKWRAKISAYGKTICLGRFNSQEEAASAYDHAAKKHHGDFAVLNEVNSD